MGLLRGRHPLRAALQGALWLLFLVMVVFSLFLLWAQAIRTSPEDSLRNNVDVIVIGAAYVLVVVFSVLVCIKRRIAIFRRLQRIHKGSATRGVGEAPKVCRIMRMCTYSMLTSLQQVVDFITQEYARSALIAYESIPKNVVQEGWGRLSECVRCFSSCFCNIVQQIRYMETSTSAALYSIPSPNLIPLRVL